MSVSALSGEIKINKILYFCPKEHYYLTKIRHKTHFYIFVTWADSSSNCPFFNCLQ